MLTEQEEEAELNEMRGPTILVRRRKLGALAKNTGFTVTVI